MAAIGQTKLAGRDARAACALRGGFAPARVTKACANATLACPIIRLAHSLRPVMRGFGAPVVGLDSPFYSANPVNAAAGLLHCTNALRSPSAGPMLLINNIDLTIFSETSMLCLCGTSINARYAFEKRLTGRSES